MYPFGIGGMAIATATATTIAIAITYCFFISLSMWIVDLCRFYVSFNMLYLTSQFNFLCTTFPFFIFMFFDFLFFFFHLFHSLCKHQKANMCPERYVKMRLRNIGQESISMYNWCCRMKKKNLRKPKMLKEHLTLFKMNKWFIDVPTE